MIKYMQSRNKGGIHIENYEIKLEKIKNLIESEDRTQLKEIFKKVLNLKIKEIAYDKKLKLDNISEYEFELVKVKATLCTNETVEMYLKMVKNTKIKESIFCYWCTIYEEELEKNKENDDIGMVINKVLISELNKKKYYQNIFLEIENNKSGILETGTEVNFLEIQKYIKDNSNYYGNLNKYFSEDEDDVLLVGIKIKRKNVH